jgi:4-hydroxy-tetrahydrodipicolinate synthase
MILLYPNIGRKEFAMAIFKGSGVAIITPFKDDGAIDFDKMGELIDWQIEQGSDAIVVVGSTGEASCLYDDEHLKTIEYTVQKTAGRLPVIAGVGSNQTEHGIKLSRGAQKLGVDALLHVTPYYNKASRRGLIEHFNVIADSVDIPILLYSVQSRTGMNITPDVAAELAKHPNITGIKEASGSITQVAEIARVTPDDFDIYSGNDDMVVPLLSLGGAGVISVVANILPRETHDMVMKFLEGDVKAACKLQLDMKPLIDALFMEVNPIPVKAALSLMGRCGYNYRRPLCPMDEGNLEKLKEEMRVWGLI